MGLPLPKQYLTIGDAPILIHTVRAFCACDCIHAIIITVPQHRIDETEQLLQSFGLTSAPIKVAAGGRRRQDSVRAGLELLDDSTDIVLVHDGARPLITPALITTCYNETLIHGAVIAAVPVKDTLKKGSADQMIAATVDRSHLWSAQTPQAARLDLLNQAYRDFGDNDVTDEASLLEMAGIPVKIVEGSETNIKVTRPEDLQIAETIMNRQTPPQMRIGHGFDAHRFAPDRPLVLGGIEIPYALGLAGHSDADVLTHALCDALLGALGAGDIGSHFPDSDNTFKNIYSISLLTQVITLMATEGFVLTNGDITLVCQAPKIAPHIEAMRTTIAEACGVETSRINIKATTTEKMGYTGRQEGISCHAVVLLHATSQTL